MQKDLELRLISLIQEKGKLNEAIKWGLDADCFVIYKDQYEFIIKYQHKYSAQPSNAILQANYHDFELLLDINEDELKYLIDELIKSKISRQAIGIINQYSDVLIIDPYGASEAIISKLSKLHKMGGYTTSHTDKDAIERLQALIDRKAALTLNQTVGIRTGLSVLDRKLLGWQPGNLIIIVGRPKIGKSWLALYMACAAYSSGKKVLYLSPEMSIFEVELRWDTLMGKMSGYSFLNDKLMMGDIDQTKYKDWLTKASKRQDWITLDNNKGKPFDSAAIASLIDEYRPDLAVIDGVALITGPGESKWERVMNVIYDAKATAQNSKAVIIGVCQASKEAGEGMPQPTQIAYSDAILQACDAGIMMNADPEMPDVRYCSIPVARGMAPINKRMIIQFDPNSGVFKV